MIPLIQSVCSTPAMYIELVYRFGKRNIMPMMLSVTEYTHPLCAVFWYSCHIQNIKRVKIILLFLILFIRDAYVKRRVCTLFSNIFCTVCQVYLIVGVTWDILDYIHQEYNCWNTEKFKGKCICLIFEQLIH